MWPTKAVENGLHDWKGIDNIDKGGFAVFEEFGLCVRRESVFVPVTIAAMLAPAYTENLSSSLLIS